MGRWTGRFPFLSCSSRTATGKQEGHARVGMSCKEQSGALGVGRMGGSPKGWGAGADPRYRWVEGKPRLEAEGMGGILTFSALLAAPTFTLGENRMPTLEMTGSGASWDTGRLFSTHLVPVEQSNLIATRAAQNQ